MKKRLLLLSLATLTLISSCDEEETTGPTTPVAQVPSTYTFSDAEGNNTVSFSGQAQRLEMLSEMVTYMKTTNTAGNSIDATILKNMYANEAIVWMDNEELDMNASTKQLKNKTAAAPSGIADPAIQSSFEGVMEDLASLSATTVSGEETGGPGVGGIVRSTSNTDKKYLQSANGVEYAQIIEKGLMGAVFYNQITQNYLGADEMNSDNTMAVDPDNGKHYTEMMHAWDEAYGYFTTATDFAVDGNGPNRFWGKYANGREDMLGSASTISAAFRTGRQAIEDNDLAVRDAQITIIRSALEKVAAGTAIHYLNGAVADFSDNSLRNHQLSEAVAFIGCLPYGFEPIADQGQVAQWYATIGSDYYNVTTASLLSVRDEIAAAAGLTDLKEQL